MVFKKLSRLALNWMSQPEMLRRYWDQAMTAIETPSLPDAIDDVAAKAQGVPIGGLYHTAGAVKQRLT